MRLSFKILKADNDFMASLETHCLLQVFLASGCSHSRSLVVIQHEGHSGGKYEYRKESSLKGRHEAAAQKTPVKDCSQGLWQGGLYCSNSLNNK